jgi:cytochrome c
MPLPMNRFTRTIRDGLALGLALAASGAWASTELALEQGCFSCHGSLPSSGAPTFAQLAAKYARYRDVSEAEVKLADRLRNAPLFGGISAHERVTEESARALMRWIIQGAQ